MRKTDARLFLLAVIPMWAADIPVTALKAPAWWYLTILPAFLLGQYLRSVARDWEELKGIGYRISDEVAARLASHNDRSKAVRVVKRRSRKLPPRILYVVVVKAEIGKPISVYRGWQLFS